MKNEIKNFSLTEIDGFIVTSKTKLEGLVQQYKDHYDRKPIVDKETGVKRQLTAEEVTALKDKIDGAVKEVQGFERQRKYKILRLSPDPMMAGIKDPAFEVTVTVKNTPNKDYPNKYFYELNTAVKFIDLRDLKKECKKDNKDIGKDPQWVEMLDALNYQLYAHMAYRFNNKVIPKVDFKMAKLAREIDLATKEGGFDMASPVSKRQIDHAINACVRAIIGEDYRATKHDYDALLFSYLTKDKKKLCTFDARKSGADFNRQFLDLLHNVVTGCGYTVNAKTVKK